MFFLFIKYFICLFILRRARSPEEEWFLKP